jgi:hypothetical protein
MMEPNEQNNVDTATASVTEASKDNFSDFSSMFGEDTDGNLIVAKEEAPADPANPAPPVDGDAPIEGVENNPTDGTVEQPKEGEATPELLTEEDIFLAGTTPPPAEGEPQAITFDWKSHSMELGFEIEENTKEAFNKAYENKINTARQELNLDNYDPLTKDIISFVNDKKGDPLDFILNDELVEARSFLRKTDEDKYRFVRYNEIFNSDKSKTDEEIGEIIDGELESIDDASFNRIITNVNNTVKGIEQKAIKGIVDKKIEHENKEKADKEASRIEQRNTLKSKIKGVKSFVGVPLTDQFQNILLSNVDNGEVDRFISENQQEVMLFGYLHMKYGDRVTKYFNEKIKTDARKSYNTGIEKAQRTLHNIPEKETVQTGHASPNPNTSDKPGWGNEKID